MSECLWFVHIYIHSSLKRAARVARTRLAKSDIRRCGFAYCSPVAILG